MLLWDRIQSTAGASLESLSEATFTRCRAWLLDRVNLDLDKLRLLLWLPQPLHHPHQVPPGPRLCSNPDTAPIRFLPGKSSAPLCHSSTKR